VVKKRIIKIYALLGFISMLLVTSLSWSKDNLTDPYEIFNKHLQAIGGLDNVKAESTAYIEAKLSAYGLEGSLLIWSKLPLYERQQIDLKVYKQVSGDNGEYKWTADANGKVQVLKDEETQKRRTLQRLTAQYDFLNRNSSMFKLTYTGIEKVGEVDCYVVKMTNSVNADFTSTFFNTSSFFIEKEVTFSDGKESHTLFSDYRQINGVFRSFQRQIKDLPEGNVTLLQVTKYESNLEIAPTIFEPSAQKVRDYRFTNGSSSENVPLEYIMNHIFVWVKMGGKERLWFFDTGTGINVIDSSFASELGIQPAGDIKGQGAGNIASVSVIQSPPFSVRGIEFDSQTMVAYDIKSTVSTKMDLDIAGILGYDFISRFVVKVDYANKVISFYDPETFKYNGGGKLLNASFKDNIPAVSATVDGKYTGLWELDTGAGDCDFHYPYAQRNALLERKGIDIGSIGAGGMYISRLVQFDSFELGGYKVNKPIIGITPEKLSGSFGTAETAGNLGNDVLRHFIIYFDYTKQQLIIEKGNDFDRKFPVSKFPLQVMYNDKKQMEVMFVTDNSLVSKAGFKAGDIIVAINDIGVEYLNGLIAMQDLLKAEAGTVYKFAILRNGQNKSIKIELKELFEN
jgi:hypothetical protein